MLLMHLDFDYLGKTIFQLAKCGYTHSRVPVQNKTIQRSNSVVTSIVLDSLRLTITGFRKLQFYGCRLTFAVYLLEIGGNTAK